MSFSRGFSWSFQCRSLEGFVSNSGRINLLYCGFYYSALKLTSNMDVSVADAAVLDGEGDVLLPGNIPRDLQLLELALSRGLAPGHRAGGVVMATARWNLTEKNKNILDGFELIAFLLNLFLPGSSTCTCRS